MACHVRRSDRLHSRAIHFSVAPSRRTLHFQLPFTRATANTLPEQVTPDLYQPLNRRYQIKAVPHSQSNNSDDPNDMLESTQFVGSHVGLANSQRPTAKMSHPLDLQHRCRPVDT